MIPNHTGTQDLHTVARGHILVAADVHLNPTDKPGTNAFLTFLEQEGSRAGAIVFLGDLFDFWLGAPWFQQPHHRELADALLSLRRMGIKLAYVEGNRDFHIARFQKDVLFDWASEGMLRLVRGGRRLLFVHGDRLNRQDHLYRLWNALIKNPPVRIFLNRLPHRWVIRAGDMLESRLRSTNRRFRTYFPYRQCARFAGEQFRRGCDAIILGHFHRRRHIRYPTGRGRPGEVYVLPPWIPSQTCLRIEPDGTALFQPWDAGKSPRG